MRAAKPEPPAAKSSLSDQAFSALEEMIVTLQLPPGSLWSEAMLSESIGIGRTPVREAVQRLAEYHLVVIMKRHGIRIAEVNEQEQLLVLETRRELERLIATRAARRASVEDKKTLASMAQALLKAGKAGDVVEMLRQYFVAKTFTAELLGQPLHRPGDRAALHPVAALLLHASQGAERPLGSGAPACRAAARDRHRRRAGGGGGLRAADRLRGGLRQAHHHPRLLTGAACATVRGAARLTTLTYHRYSTDHASHRATSRRLPSATAASFRSAS